MGDGDTVRMSSVKARSLADLPAHMHGDWILLRLCGKLHEWRTGSNDSTYALWGEDPEGEARDIETLQCRLEAWTENDGPWAAFDEAVRNLIRVVLVEYGEVPRG